MIIEDKATLEILTAAGIIIASAIIGKVAFWFIGKYVHELAKKTKSTLDDRLLAAIELPLLLGIICLGIYIALTQISMLSAFYMAILNFFTSALILIGAILLLRLCESTMDWYSEEVAPKSKIRISEIAPTFKRILRAFVAIIATIMVLDNFGVEISPLLASLGIAGLAVALAFQDTLGNFFAGVYITADRPVKAGDYIRLDGGDEGYVVKIGWRSTQIRTLANNIVVIPNSKLAQSTITNFHNPDKQMSVLMQVSVSYESDLEKVEKVTVDVAKKMQKTVIGAVTDFEPFIRFHTFGESGIGFSVILRVNEFVDQYLLKHEFIKNLSKAYRGAGIEIPYPKRDLYIRESTKWKKR